MMLFALSLLLFPLISVAAISDSDYLKQNLDVIKRDESVAIKEELGRVTEWKFRDLEEIVNIKKIPQSGNFLFFIKPFWKLSWPNAKFCEQHVSWALLCRLPS